MRPGSDECFHLTVGIVREIHAEALARFGGLDGVRDLPLLGLSTLSCTITRRWKPLRFPN